MLVAESDEVFFEGRDDGALQGDHLLRARVGVRPEVPFEVIDGLRVLPRVQVGRQVPVIHGVGGGPQDPREALTGFGLRGEQAGSARVGGEQQGEGFGAGVQGEQGIADQVPEVLAAREAQLRAAGPGCWGGWAPCSPCPPRCCSRRS